MLDPVAWAELSQLLKAAGAAVAAWAIATYVFDLSQAFLAPWSALLVLHATIYRTVSEGAQQVAANVLGVLLAWLAGNLLGLDPVVMGVMLVVALALGKVSALRLDGTAVATTAVIVLTVGQSDENQVLLLRFLDVGIGIAVGLAVNLLVWPPLSDRSAARAIAAIDDRVGALLMDMAGELGPDSGMDMVQDWIDRTRGIDEAIDEAWGLIGQARESGRFNPRRGAGALKEGREFNELLNRMEQATNEIRSMARTLGHSISSLNEWVPEFRNRWVRLLAEAGDAIIHADSQRLTAVGPALVELTHDLSTGDLADNHWPEYGGLVLNLRNIVSEMDRVADSDPVAMTTTRERRAMFRR